MNTPIYRDAALGDQSRIAEFQLAMAQETENLKLEVERVQKGVAAVFADPGKGRYLVCELNGQVIGSLLITYEWSDWRNAQVWWIHSLYVNPEYRSKGYFSGFYTHIKKMAEHQGVRGLRLYVDKSNESAQRIYQKLGMTSEHYELYEWMTS